MPVKSRMSKKWLACLGGRSFYFRLRKCLKWVLTGLVLFFSPFLVWVILALNRELIVVMANWKWLSANFPALFETIGDHVNTREFAAGFNEAALGGLLTLFGVIVTVWYYHVVRMGEVKEKRLFIIDELLEELRKNQDIVFSLSGSGEELSIVPTGDRGTIFETESWHKIGPDAALLPRRLYMRLSVLYSCLNRCRKVEDYYKNRAAIDRINDVITELQRYRSSLSWYEFV